MATARAGRLREATSRCALLEARALLAASALVRGASDVALAVQLRDVSGELDRSFRSLTPVTGAARG